MASRRRFLEACLVLTLLSFAAANSARTESLQKLRGMSYGESNSELFVEALEYVNQNQHALGRSIENLEQALAKKGERILVPSGNPPIYPKGRFTRKWVEKDAHNQTRFLSLRVDAEWQVTEETTHRFLLETMSVNRKDGRMQGSSCTSTIGTTGTKRLGLGTGLIQPGKHDVLHILIARPIKSDAPPKILDVERSVVDVPSP